MGAVRPLRVFHLIKGFGRGGAERLLADGPARSDPAEFRYAFGYFVPWKDALVPDVRRVGEVTCFDAGSPAVLAARTARVARVIRRFDADVIHCHLPLASVVGRVAGALLGVPVVSTEHNVLERYHVATRMAALATWRLQKHVIAVSDEVARSIARHASTTVPVTVVRNGVDVSQFSRAVDTADARRRLGFDRGACVVGTVAVFRSQKRLDLWMEAAARIAHEVPSSRFVVVGDGPLRSEVDAAVRRLGLSGKVVFPGLVEDVRPFLAAMDVYMMSSDFEGLPVALLEAMAAGVVPVTTDAGGIAEVVTEDAGVTVRRGDPAALAAAVTRVLALPVEAKTALSAAARRRVEAEFSVDAMMRQVEAVYRQVTRHG